MRRFLRQIVPMRPLMVRCEYLPENIFCIGGRFGMRCAVGVALHSDGRHRNDRAFRKPLLQVFVFRLSLDEPLSPAIIVRASIPHDSVAGHIVQIINPLGPGTVPSYCVGLATSASRRAAQSMQHQAKSHLADPIHDSFTPPLTSLSRDDSIVPHETSGRGAWRERCR